MTTQYSVINHYLFVVPPLLESCFQCSILNIGAVNIFVFKLLSLIISYGNKKVCPLFYAVVLPPFFGKYKLLLTPALPLHPPKSVQP